jgi:aminoglycoside 3-N-acetyltransferase
VRVVRKLAVTQDSIGADLWRLGVPRGGTVLLHSSLSALGEVPGGAAGVLAVLRGLLGPEGTLVVPTFTEGNSLSSRAYRRAVRDMSPEQEARHRSRMPAFDRDTTPSSGMGRIAEQLRTTEGAIRSDHPQTSFAALGPSAPELMKEHQLECHLGPMSPLGRLYQSGAHVLLLGIGYEACTAFHLAEYLLPEPPMTVYRCVVKSGDAQREWCEYEDIVLDDTDFPKIGDALDRTGIVARALVGSAVTRLLPMAPAVRFATNWLLANRSGRRAGR